MQVQMEIVLGKSEQFDELMAASADENGAVSQNTEA